MRRSIVASVLASLAATLAGQTRNDDAGGALRHLVVAPFPGSGVQSIQAMRSDSVGNLYVAGTTSSFDFVIKNAAQPSIGEALLMRSLDRGLTWQKVSNPVAPITITPDPGEAQTLFIGGWEGIYKTNDGGHTWRHVYTWGPSRDTLGSRTNCFSIAIDPANTRRVYASSAGSMQFIASNDGTKFVPKRLLD